MRQTGQKRLNLLVDLVFVIIVLVLIGGSRRFLEKSSDASDSETEQLQDFLILEPNEEISALYADEQGQVYVGTNHGIHIYDASSKEIISKIDNIRMVYTASIIGDGKGGVWVGHEGGLTHIRKGGEQELFAYPELPEGRVNAIAERDGRIYCGTYNGAAVLTETDGVWSVSEQLDQASGLLCDSVNVILPVEHGLLLGSYLASDGGVTVLADDGIISYVEASSGLPHPYVTSALQLEDGTVLLGMGYMRDGALAELIPEGDSYRVGHVYTKADGLPGEKVRYLFEDDDSIWITTEYDGVVIRDKQTEQTKYLTEESGLSDNEIKCITKAEGYYWLGGKYGLTVVPESVRN